MLRERGYHNVREPDKPHQMAFVVSRIMGKQLSCTKPIA